MNITKLWHTQHNTHTHTHTRTCVSAVGWRAEGHSGFSTPRLRGVPSLAHAHVLFVYTYSPIIYFLQTNSYTIKGGNGWSGNARFSKGLYEFHRGSVCQHLYQNVCGSYIVIMIVIIHCHLDCHLDCRHLSPNQLTIQ